MGPNSLNEDPATHCRRPSRGRFCRYLDCVARLAQPHTDAPKPLRRERLIAGALALVSVIILVGWFALLSARVTDTGAQAPIISGVLAFYALLTFGSCALVLLLLAVSLKLAAPRPRTTFAVVMPVAVILLAASVVQVSATPWPVAATHVPPPAPGTLRILEWNVSQGSVPAQNMLELIRETKPDIVVLAELYSANASIDQFGGNGIPHGYAAVGTRDIAVTVLVSKELGSYRATDPDPSGATSGFVARPPKTADLPTIVAVHLSRQTPRGDVTGWHQGLRWVSNHCDDPDTIAVGDFNTETINVPSQTLGSCRFPATTHEVGLAPTWPTALPAVAGTTIDHVLAGPAWHVNFLKTLTGAPANGSDHRPTFAIISTRH